MKRVILIMLVMLLTAIFAVPAFTSESRFSFTRKTVEDKRTGLIWMRDADLGRLDWVGASNLVESLNIKEYAGFNDWRLPTRDELDTLLSYAIRANYSGGVDASSPYKLFNKLGFNDTQNYWYWTSTPYYDNTTYVWVISMYDGTVRGENKDSTPNVWPVRGGK